VKFSEYGVQLREKQKVKRMYGLLEAGFRHAYHDAAAAKGKTGENLLQTLELRLDNVVFRLGFAASRAEARQIVRHGHIQVNGRKVSLPSFLVKVGNQVQLKTTSSLQERIGENLSAGRGQVPQWLEVLAAEKRGLVRGLPLRDDIQIPVQEQLIVELYSK
jgi:small subunit ribosomal protein S4